MRGAAVRTLSWSLPGTRLASDLIPQFSFAFFTNLSLFTMESIFILSSTTYILIAVLLTVIITAILDFLRQKRSQEEVLAKDGLKELPGPWSWPVIGSLHLLGGYEVPYQAFASLAQRFGSVFRLDLGSQPCVVINGLNNIREVLMAKGTHFDGRPNFRRYHQLFCGDKENCK